MEAPRRDDDARDVRFRVTTRPDGDRVRVEVRGELDIGTVEAVDREVREQRAQGADAIVLDLSRLAFIDSSGLRLLLQLDAAARSDGFDFALIDGDGPVRRLLELTHLTEDFQRAGP